MSSETKIKGLCSTCKYVRGCVYLTNSKQPIHQCEEFEVVPKEESETGINEIFKDEKFNIEVDLKNLGLNIESDIYTGLCKNCDDRKNCKSTDPDKVIWHCEEYQ